MRTLRRATSAAIVELCGIAIAVGAMLTWIDARDSRPKSGLTHTSIAALFEWTYMYTPSFVRSFAVVVLVAGVGVLVGGLTGSRFLTSLFCIVTLAAAVLWIALNAKHYRPTSLTSTDLQIGAWFAIGGGVIGQLSAFVLQGGGA